MDNVVGLFFVLSLYQVECLITMLPFARVGCITDGRHFQPGEEISRGKSGSWCFGSICNTEGQVIHWDDWNCNNDETTRPNLQQSGTTKQPGCYTGDGWMQPGDITLEGRRRSYCFGFYCSADGILSSWDDWNCLS